MKTFVAFLVFFLACIASASPLSDDSLHGRTDDHVDSIFGNSNLRTLQNGVSEADLAPGPAPLQPLVLAAKRTNRPDILHGFKRYKGGWDISNRHYWASVGFTGAAGFILAMMWFVAFGLVLIVHHFIGWRMKIQGKGSKYSRRIYLIMLILFTCGAAIGCILLSVGQDEFHHEVLHTLNYVVNQSDYTVDTLRNVTEYLSLAKSINVAQVFLPSNVMDDIDKLDVDLNTAANTLEDKTTENAGKIRRVFNLVRSALITVAAIMLLLALLGLVLSLLQHQHAIYIFILSGWLLVAMTFILWGVFIIFNNVISDTCLAMGEWVENPQAESALSDILPCVDQKTTNQTLYKSKVVVNDIVNVVNQFIYTNANTYPPKNSAYYYNQSGPAMPALCYPYTGNLEHRQCTAQEVSMGNASKVWKNYTCSVSESGLCTTPGRVTPEMYIQLVGAVNESYALEHYAPPLLSLQNCNFVRETFEEITMSYCPPLEHQLQKVDAGLGLISVGAMLCLIIWILYANRPQREEVFVGPSSRATNDSSKNSSKIASNNNSSSHDIFPSRPAGEV